MTAERSPTVSVCVAAYNEERHLGKLLDSLCHQTLPPLEVIVADDGSRDRTAAIAEQQGATVLRLPHRGPAAARNSAAGVARGEVLALVDADVRCAPEYLECLVKPIADGRAVGTFSREVYLANTHNRWASAYAALRWSPPDRLLPADFPDRWDVFNAIRRDRFLAVGGYDDVGYGEDRTIARKLDELALVAPGAVCFHHHPDTVHEIFENGRWVGRGAAIRTLPRPWRAHSLPRVIRLAFRQIREGRTPWVLPARIVYHSGVWLGLAETSLRPARHWK
jgi:glycosyltransferase involved in cell wall biosynthesis